MQKALVDPVPSVAALPVRLARHLSAHFFESKHKKTLIVPVGRYKRTGAATFPTTWKCNPLFEHMATEIGVYQSIGHFLHGLAQGVVAWLRLAHTKNKLASFQNSLHKLTISLSDICGNDGFALAS